MSVSGVEIPAVDSNLVVQVCPCFVDLERETGGVANIVRQICLKLASSRVTTLLLCGNTELGKSVAEPGKKTISDFLAVEVFAQRGNPLLGPAGSLRRRIAALPPDAILHVHTCFSAFTESGMRAALNRKIPFVFTPHGKLSREMLCKNRVPKKIWWHFRAKPLVRSAARVCLSSSREADGFPKLGLTTGWEVIPNGFEPVDGCGSDLLPEIADQYILFLGYLDPRKQPEFLVRVFAESTLRETYRLVIAGPDSYGHRATVESTTRALGITDRVVFTGNVTGARKWALLRGATCLCLPSLAEGMPVVLAEALGAGTPSIYSSACNFPELARRGAGIEINGFEQHEWANALEKVCNSGELRHQMRQSANQLAPEYTWAAIVKRWVALYDAIRKQRNG